MSDQRRSEIWDRVGAIYADLEITGDKAARARLVSELHALFLESDNLIKHNIKQQGRQ